MSIESLKAQSIIDGALASVRELGCIVVADGTPSGNGVWFDKLRVRQIHTAPKAEDERFTPGPWRIGRRGAVVADYPVHEVRGSDHIDYYGGHLVCESVAARNAALIALAPEMFAVLSSIENGSGQVPIWLWKRIEAIKAAISGPDRTTLPEGECEKKE